MIKFTYTIEEREDGSWKINRSSPPSMATPHEIELYKHLVMSAELFFDGLEKQGIRLLRTNNEN